MSATDSVLLRALESESPLHAHRSCMTANPSVASRPGAAPALRLLPASRGLLAAIVESSEDAIISRTLEGTITSWNAAAERLFGYTAEEAIGQSLVRLLIPDDRKNEETIMLDRTHHGERIEHFDTLRKTKDGRLLDVSLTISPVRDAKSVIVGASMIARDITEQKRMQRELEDADRRKIEFLVLLGHELRNPLGPIRHAVNILRARTPRPDELEWATNVIDRQAEHLTRLIEDLLDVSRVTRGTIELRQDLIDIATILMAAVEGSTTLIEKSQHQLRVTPPYEPLLVYGDATSLTKVVMNLLENAAKYTDRGGRIWLSAEREGDEAVIRVNDSGIGVSADLLPHIFDMFTLAAMSLERSRGGLGVGLSLVDRLVKLHGGTVTAASAGPGTGSEFTIRLPTAEKRHRLGEAPAPSVSEDRLAAR